MAKCVSFTQNWTTEEGEQECIVAPVGIAGPRPSGSRLFPDCGRQVAYSAK